MISYVSVSVYEASSGEELTVVEAIKFPFTFGEEGI